MAVNVNKKQKPKPADLLVIEKSPDFVIRDPYNSASAPQSYIPLFAGPEESEGSRTT